MNYSNDPSMVRVDFFKQGGKWYTTEAVKWLTYGDGGLHPLITTAFQEAIVTHLRKEDGTVRLGGMIAVCLDPYHAHAHPIMTVVPECTPFYAGSAVCAGCTERLNKPYNIVKPVWNGSIWVCPECNNNLNHQSKESTPGVWFECRRN